jgi:hypothetical protein
VEGSRLTERLAQRAFGLSVEVDVHRADLQPDAAGFEQREPRARERALLPCAVSPPCQLEQEVEMEVRHHRS